MLEDMAFGLVKTIAKFPRGGFFAARSLARVVPGLRHYPVPTNYGPIVCDLREPVCFPLIEFGEYPHWGQDVELFNSIIEPHHFVVDIGANIGVTTRLFAERAAQVHAFEPAPRALPMLRANSGPNVIVHAVALSDSDGTTFFREEKKLDLSGVSDTGVEIPMRTLDSYGLKPDFIKIDVEGHEPAVLRGARETLQCSPIIVFEALSDEARTVCQDLILDANPGYRFEKFGQLNNVARPVTARPGSR